MSTSVSAPLSIQDQPPASASADDIGSSSPAKSKDAKKNEDGDTSLATILVGLSGPSSSGKTTLARLLRTIFDFEVTVSVLVPVPDKDGSGRGGESGNGSDSGRPASLNGDDSARQSQAERWKLTLFVLHEDDFYKTDKDVPYITVSSPEHGSRTLQDWDCVESLDLPLLEHTLRHVRDHGTLPPDTMSKEDQNAIGPSGISDTEVNHFKSQVKAWFEGYVASKTKADSSSVLDSSKTNAGSGLNDHEIRICVLDGFLLYPEPPEPTTMTSTITAQDSPASQTAPGPSSSQSASPSASQAASPSTSLAASHLASLAHLHEISRTLLDRRLFLPVTRAQMLTRRQARMGYVTLEGFWVDPPGYVEDVVWPNYARDHAWMYVDHDVERGVFDGQICRQHKVDVCPGQGGLGMREVLDWAVERVEETVVDKIKTASH